MLKLNANSGPVFLTYRGHENIDEIITEEMIKRPMFHFVADDGVTHTGWKVVNEEALIESCKAIDVAYVADGHHRSASAARAAGAASAASAARLQVLQVLQVPQVLQVCVRVW